MRNALLVACLLGGCPRRTAPEADPALGTLLASHLGEGVPALGVLVRQGEETRMAVVGQRRAGHDDPVQMTDPWHLGSDTKAMTATLVSILEQRGVVRWSQTLPESFPDLTLHPAWREVTLEELARHRSGVTGNLPREQPMAWLALMGRSDGPAARADVVAALLQAPPSNPTGGFHYSNSGYMILGAALEAATGTSWQSLMREHLFEPLGMTGCGFGPPTGDAPRGHRGGQPIAPDAPGSDNPVALGPAGTVHCPLLDWSRFVQAHAEGATTGHPLLPPDSWRALHTPDGDYAAGWIVDADRGLLAHDGSNTLWYASTVIAPDRDRFVLVVSNAASDPAMRAVRQTMRRLFEESPVQ